MLPFRSHELFLSPVRLHLSRFIQAPVMPRSLTRPSSAGIAEIQNTFIECELTPRSRRHLRAVLAWANGKTTRQVAADKSLNMSDFTVRSAIHLYLKKGVHPFVRPPPLARGGRPATKTEVQAEVIRLLRESRQGGNPMTYRKVKEQTGVSLSTISKLAKASKLEPRQGKGERVHSSASAPRPEPKVP